jgi:hypothetical protein
MEREQVRTVVRTTLLVQARLSRRTRTLADDLMTSILQANEERIVDAVLKLLASPEQPPTEQQVVEAIEAVGIRL